MKKLLQVICLVAYLDTQAQSSFQENILTGTRELIVSATGTKDGGYIMAGDLMNSSVSWDMYVVKLDAFGKVQWSKSISSPDWDHAKKIIQTRDGGYAIAGYTTKVGGNHWDMRLVKLDPKGNIEWSKFYVALGSQVTQGNCLAQTPDGGYAIGGYIEGGQKSITAGLIIKTDSLGNLMLARKIFEKTDLYYLEVNSIIVTADGGAAGLVNYPGKGVILIKLASNGALEWAKSANDPIMHETASFLLQATDHGFLCGGYGYYGTNSNDIFALKTDSSGKLRWMKRIQTAKNDFVFDAIEISNNRFILAGGTRTRKNTFLAEWYAQPYAITLNSKGEILDTKVIQADTIQIRAVMKSASGGFALAGYFYFNYQEYGYLSKFDETGNICYPTVEAGTDTLSSGFSNINVPVSPVIISVLPGTDTAENIPATVQVTCSNVPNSAKQYSNFTFSRDNFKVSVYTNPVRERLILELTSKEERQVQMQVVSINGKAMLSDVVRMKGKVTKSFNVRVLQKGVYFIVLKEGNNVRKISFLKE